MGAAQHCLYCNGLLAKVVFSGVRDRLGISQKTWSFRSCGSCGSAILDPQPSLEELQSSYPSQYHLDQVPRNHILERFQYDFETKFFYKPLWRYSVKAVKKVTGLASGKLLDVGGGSGHRSKLFQQAGFEVTVVDFDEKALQVAEQRFGLRVVPGSLETTQLSANHFDLVTLWCVVEHLADPSTTLKVAARVLRPGGWLVAQVPLMDSWQGSLFKSRWCAVTDAPRHTGIPTQRGMEQLLRRCGLRLYGFLRASLLDSAGTFALSLIPRATTPICYGRHSSTSRLLWRLLGLAFTLVGAPFSWLEALSGHPRAAIFFAQKLENV